MTFTEALTRRRIPFRSAPNFEVRLCCPWCPERRGEPDTNFCLHVNTKSGAGHCWHSSCNFKGRHLLFLILKKLQIPTDIITDGEAPQAPLEPVELPKDFQVLSRVYDDLDRQARQYLLKRGILKEQIVKHRIGVSYVGRFAYRILFPIWEGKQLRFINARDFTGNQKPKYLNTRGDKYLYNFDPKAEVCIFSEGVFKALRIAQISGECCSASLLGHDLTATQLEQLKRSVCRHLILWPDPDAVGCRGMLNIAEKLSSDWSGKIEMVWPVLAPADEQPLAELGTALQNKAKYSKGLWDKVRLDSH